MKAVLLLILVSFFNLEKNASASASYFSEGGAEACSLSLDPVASLFEMVGQTEQVEYFTCYRNIALFLRKLRQQAAHSPQFQDAFENGRVLILDRSQPGVSFQTDISLPIPFRSGLVPFYTNPARVGVHALWNYHVAFRYNHRIYDFALPSRSAYAVDYFDEMFLIWPESFFNPENSKVYEDAFFSRENLDQNMLVTELLPEEYLSKHYSELEEGSSHSALDLGIGYLSETLSRYRLRSY